jgi:hypothetical protein
MDGFYQLLSLMISLAGFGIVAGSLLLDGECLLVAAGKGIVVFIVLTVLQRVLAGVFKYAAACRPRTGATDGDSADRE